MPAYVAITLAEYQVWNDKLYKTYHEILRTRVRAKLNKQVKDTKKYTRGIAVIILPTLSLRILLCLLHEHD